jgi:hypothetical protein
MQVSWELPLFSIGATSVGARANTQSAFADLRGARVTLAADVAQAYVDLRAAQASRAALQRSVEPPMNSRAFWRRALAPALRRKRMPPMRAAWPKARARVCLA